uniref:Uncharacterized protein n=1 Tax=uncultured prokaryote TaxID=198431 RepID=A0A0H5QPJ4_9ZZZZ|nr:hypothetical protein [uncultured prokaryote]
MARIIGMMVLPGPSGQPTDVFVNTWQFESATAGLDTVKGFAIANALDAFYLELASYYPDDLGDPLYKFYDADEGMPRTPLEVAPLWTPTGTLNPLPREVAVTASFYSVKNTPSQRGRVYLGPLTAITVTTGARPEVPLAFREDVVTAGQALGTSLLNDTNTDIKWVVYSPTNGTVNAVTDVWCDNAHDTIRSRGTEPSEREAGVVDQGQV